MNKKITFLLILLVSVFTLTYAQVSEEERAMSKGINNAITVEISGTSIKIAERVWKDYMKQYKAKLKRNRKSDEWTATKLKIAGIGGTSPLTIYAQVQGDGREIEVAMWVPMEEGYLSSSSHPDEYKTAEKLLTDYALDVKIETVKEELKGEEKELASLEKDLKKLKKDNDGYHKDIKNAENKIENSEKGLIQNADDQKVAIENVRNAEDLFEIQKDTLEIDLSNATSKDEKKSIKKMIRMEEKKVKEVKGEKKKVEKEEKKLRKTIESSKKTIKESEDNIAQNEKDQKTKEQEIDKQKKVIEEVDRRLKRLYDYK